MMNDRHAQLLQHIEHANLEGIEELEDEDLITGVVVLLRVERPAEDGSALVMTSDVDFFSQLGLLVAARQLMQTDDDG